MAASEVAHIFTSKKTTAERHITQQKMNTQIDTVKITMTIEEAKEFSQQMKEIFDHFNSAVNSVGKTSVEQLMLDYPAVSKFYEMLKIYSNKNDSELPW